MIREAYQQLSMEEAYAVFRLAAMHHKKVSENLEQLKKEQPESIKRRAAGDGRKVKH